MTLFENVFNDIVNLSVLVGFVLFIIAGFTKKSVGEVARAIWDWIRDEEKT